MQRWWSATQSLLSALTGTLCLALLLAGTGWLASQLAFFPGHASPIWPPAGISLAVLLRFGVVALPGIWLGAHLLLLLQGWTQTESDHRWFLVLVTITLATGSAFQSLVAAWWIQQDNDFEWTLQRERDLLRFLLFGGPIGCIIAPTVHVLTWSTFNLLPAEQRLFSWLIWWMGDLLGVVLFGPITICLLLQPRRRWWQQWYTVVLPTTFVAILVLIICFALHQRTQRRQQEELNQQVQLFAKFWEQELQQAIHISTILNHQRHETGVLTQTQFFSWVREPTCRHRAVRWVAWCQWPTRPEDGRPLPAEKLTGLPLTFLDETNPTIGKTPAWIGTLPWLQILQQVQQSGQPKLIWEPHSLSKATAAPEMIFLLLPHFDVPKQAKAKSGRFDKSAHLSVNASNELQLVSLTLIGLSLPELAKQSFAPFQSEGFQFGLWGFANNLDTKFRASPKGGSTPSTPIWLGTSEPEQWHNKWKTQLNWLPLPNHITYRLQMFDNGLWISLHLPEKWVNQRIWNTWILFTSGLSLAALINAFLMVLASRTAAIEARVEIRTHELAAAYEEMNQLRQQAEQANQAKSEFLARVSHDLRTPMTAILGFTDILISQLREPILVSHTNRIKRNGRYLLHLLNEVLDLARIESGKLELQQGDCNPWQVACEVMDAVQMRPEAEKLNLCLECLNRIPEVIQTDSIRLREILTNLLENALKFTPAGTVRLCLEFLPATVDSGPKIQFIVEDTGIGISAADQNRIFTPFSQVGDSANRNGGFGLGLAICKRLALLLGGDITVQSQPKRGSSFFVTIAPGDLSNVQWIFPTKQLPPSELTTVPNIQRGSRGVRGRVLLAEDGPDNQTLLEFLLTQAGAETVIVADGLQAVQAALTALQTPQPFDLILMDLQMPHLDGLSATRQLRQNGYLGPIVALTANAMTQDRENCLAAGFDHYLSKPIQRSELFAVLTAYLRSASNAEN